LANATTAEGRLSPSPRWVSERAIILVILPHLILVKAIARAWTPWGSDVHPPHAGLSYSQKLRPHRHHAVCEYGGVDLKDGIPELGVVGHQPGGRGRVAA